MPELRRGVAPDRRGYHRRGIAARPRPRRRHSARASGAALVAGADVSSGRGESRPQEQKTMLRETGLRKGMAAMDIDIGLVDQPIDLRAVGKFLRETRELRIDGELGSR